MNEKKKNIIVTSIDLFADKGFYSTSIQEIAEKSNVSKGAFYLHFHSKDELLLEIFKYYYDLMQENLQNATDERLSPKENFIKQVEVQFYEILKHKSFILTQLKEQAITLNKELFEFIRFKEFETHKWYKKTLIAIYGDEVKPYVTDAGNIFEGIKNRYIQILIQGDIDIPIPELASFLVERLDDIVINLLSKGRNPMLTEEKMVPIFSGIEAPEEMIKKEVVNYLLEMQKMLTEFKLEEKMFNELQGVTDFIITEVKKQDSKGFVIQGLLANFKGIQQFDKYRKLISEKLQIRLL
ncbi:TetR/AcrR family transcriptional regulator [Virgibacillus necropolis]|uniref:HTH tetR-type domain-containing protein n=1 Tax=Virgibacillus necropolis TaxID=163877 RepID=A0A221M7F3_9BACI|nr:TetR/AcrR family transcriptional regulator [Virgibacillus necropolis]ASN03567.1 hypothetical protein CFK40_00275 [Virgibacillus necropolis]